MQEVLLVNGQEEERRGRQEHRRRCHHTLHMYSIKSVNQVTVDVCQDVEHEDGGAGAAPSLLRPS